MNSFFLLNPAPLFCINTESEFPRAIDWIFWNESFQWRGCKVFSGWWITSLQCRWFFKRCKISKIKNFKLSCIFIWNALSIIKHAFIRVMQVVSVFRMAPLLPREWEILRFFFLNNETFQDYSNLWRSPRWCFKR